MLIGLDIGTSSTKGVAVREDGSIAATAHAPNPVDRPRAGWTPRCCRRCTNRTPSRAK